MTAVPSAPPPRQDLAFPREWLTFRDPGDPAHEVRADVTWLLSRWTCVFGSGCKGIVADRASDGCCTHGAFFTDEADEQRVSAAAGELTAQQWQLRAQGRRLGLVEEDEALGEQRRRTRTVDGACVFLNRPGFAAGSGCALHLLALQTDRHPLQTKPDVCWQLPVAREEEHQTRTDDEQVRVTSITEFDRSRWGAGGHELSWWCTSSPTAHVATQPLVETYAAELTELLGSTAYAELARLLALRAAGTTAAPHPADSGIGE